jgi:hypothetical protein
MYAQLDDPAAYEGVHRCPRCGAFVPDQEQLRDWCRECLTEREAAPPLHGDWLFDPEPEATDGDRE